jgi:hypothetical protein
MWYLCPSRSIRFPPRRSRFGLIHAFALRQPSEQRGTPRTDTSADPEHRQFTISDAVLHLAQAQSKKACNGARTDQKQAIVGLVHNAGQ